MQQSATRVTARELSGASIALSNGLTHIASLLFPGLNHISRSHLYVHALDCATEAVGDSDSISTGGD